MNLKNKTIQISCDGGAATGKSTGAKIIAKKYKIKFLSSGLLYRYASFLLIKYKPINEINFLKKKFQSLNYKKLDKINLHTQEISKESAIIAKIGKIRKILKVFQINLYSPEISNQSAVIAKVHKIRQILKNFQTKFAKKNKSCCIEGRDISTKILPNSDVKFFFKCDLDTASIRRYKELKKKKNKIKLQDVKKALRIRNNQDINRKNSPLLKHRDAIVIDTGKLNKLQMQKKMSKYIDRLIQNKYGN